MRLIIIFLFLIISTIIFISSMAHSRDNQEMCMYFNNTQIKCELFQIQYEDGILLTYNKKGEEELFKIREGQEKLYYFSYPYYNVEMRLRNGIIESWSEKEDTWRSVTEDEEGK